MRVNFSLIYKAHPKAIMAYIRYTSSYLYVGFPRSPQSLTDVSSWGFTASPPACNSNYLGSSLLK
ncbi:hypothetical protein C5E04_06760 [Pectobacterium parmentieri]|nr:hypothetical protein C5E04_06760 [Pectobacterium parmentieri]